MKNKNSKLLYLLPVVLLLACCIDKEQKQLTLSTVPLADPSILLYDGIYYAYGTSADNHIGVYASRNLKEWTTVHKQLTTHRMWGEHLFWVPEVYYIKEKGKFLMYYSSDDRICAAWADSPQGPFVQRERKPMLDKRAVDNSLFVDDNGKAYVYFNMFDDEGMTIWVAELENDLETIREQTMRRCIYMSQKWEEVWANVNEGAYVMKHKGKYYMFYSGNSHLSQYYGIGFATATSPLGPWTKYDKNPILQRPLNLMGAGHSSLFLDKRGRLNIVFHAHKDDKEVFPRTMYTARVTFGKDDIPYISHLKTAQLKTIEYDEN